jgi:hydrogenase maturation protease
MQPPKILVLGLGNTILQDDGLGVRTVERLMAEYDLPAEVEVLDGGVMGLDLLSRLEGSTALLIVDAVRAGLPPGTPIRLAGDAIPTALAQKMSMHQAGLQDLLAVSAFRGTLPQRVVLYGLEPEIIGWGSELSSNIAPQIDKLIDSVVQELRDWGITLQHA